MTVLEMVKRQLEADGFDGLYCPAQQCACLLDDLSPGDCLSSDCEAGYRTECSRDDSCPSDGCCAFHVGDKRGGKLSKYASGFDVSLPWRNLWAHAPGEHFGPAVCRLAEKFLKQKP